MMRGSKIEKVETYLAEVESQMRNERMRESVRKELESHIDEQAQAYIKNGEEEETAYERAVEEMGDAVDVGISFDKIYRPHLEWKFLLPCAGSLCVFDWCIWNHGTFVFIRVYSSYLCIQTGMVYLEEKRSFLCGR